MADPRNPKYRPWSKKRRFEEAVKKVVHEGWTQRGACEEFGVTRSNLGPKVQAYRDELDKRVEQAKAEEQARVAATGVGLGPLGLQERRRVPPFWEFEQTYFGHLRCPDCQIRHAVPDFHREISDAVRSTDPRVLINIPPYHSKSTNVTVKDTIYDIVCNPNSRTILVSKALDFTRTFLTSITDLLTNPEVYYGAARNLIDDWGPFKPEGQGVWNRSQIYVAGRVSAEKDPTVQCLGYGNQIYGRRADKIKFDDIATLDNQINPERVQGMLHWIDKEALSRIGKSGKAIWIGTRVNPGDIYYHLGQRSGYRVLRYPCILDDSNELTLWPDHFPYSQAMVHRSEMTPADFQLIYQNVDVPGLGASFSEEIVEACKDKSRVLGHYESKWRLVAGLDPAGGTKDSGYTSFTLWGVDLASGKRFLVDQVAVKSMRAPQLRDLMFDWTARYPIYEWRVESNGLQSQLVQYNEEIIRHLALKGVRVVPHHTQSNKWDPQFGVESIAPLMATELVSIPWGNQQTAQALQPFVEELVAFPMGRTQDRVMSMWFAELGVRDVLRRQHVPMFNERMRVPDRVRRRRHVVDFNARQVRRVPLADQRPGHLSVGQANYRRQTVGRPVPHGHESEFEPSKRRFVNVPGYVEDEQGR